MNAPTPPRLARWAISRLLPEACRSSFLHDLDAEYDRARSTIGARYAGRQYWRELFSPALFRLRRELKREGSTNPHDPRGVDLSGRSPFSTRVKGLLGETRFGFRSLRKTPGFTFIAVLSLAVGIGVNTAVFTGIHAVWLAPVPGVIGEDDVVEIIAVEKGSDRHAMTYPDFVALRESETPLVAVAGWAEGSATLGTDEGGVRISLVYTTSDYNRVLGVIPALGRAFLPTDDIGLGSTPVTIISHDLWQNQFGGEEDIIGRNITLNRIPHTVVGVAPEQFTGARPMSGANDVWVPLSQSPRLRTDAGFTDRNSIWVSTLGRLGSGATLAETNAALETIFRRLADDYPETNGDRTARAAAFGRFPAQNRVGDMLAVGMLAGLLVMLLLIICGNLAGMTLARSAAREREISVRLALGSSRGRLVTHLMVEALLLAAIGGAVGILAAFSIMPLVRPASLGIVAPGVDFVPNGGVLAASLVLTFLAALAFGLLPALRFSRPELVTSLKDDTGGGGRRVGRIHKIATSAQTGMAMLGLIIAALFARSLGSMAEREIGFQPEHLLVSRLVLSEEAYPSLDQGGEALIDHLGRSIEALPGVESMAFADGVPLDRSGWSSWVTRGAGIDNAGDSVRVEYTRATEHYFETIGSPILRGRGIVPTDDGTSEPVAVITKSLAERLWPGEDPLGKQLQRPASREERVTTVVVGVVGDVASSRFDRPLPTVFIPLRQSYRLDLMIAIRSGTDVGGLVSSVRSAIMAFDRGLPAPVFATSASLVARSSEAQKGIAGIGGGLGLMTLILAAFGVYGVAAFAVTNRTREIGLRMAMGATREDVLRAFLRDAIRLALPGLVVGALLAAASGAAMQSMLYGLSPLDPISFGIAAAVLFAVVLLASMVPSLRASRVNPMDALRWEGHLPTQ